MSDLIWYLGWFTVACISLYLINRQRMSFDAEESKPTEADLTEYMKPNALTEEDMEWLNNLPPQLRMDTELTEDFTRSERWKMGPIQTSPDWTEFKERNPELFHPKRPEDCIPPIRLTGSVLNGILFHEEKDAVIHYTLEGNIPPNGDYIINGMLSGKVLNVTSFKLVEII